MQTVLAVLNAASRAVAADVVEASWPTCVASIDVVVPEY